MQSMAFSFISLLTLRAALGVGEAAFVVVLVFCHFSTDGTSTAFVHFGVNPLASDREREGLLLLGLVLLYLILNSKKQC